MPRPLTRKAYRLKDVVCNYDAEVEHHAGDAALIRAEIILARQQGVKDEPCVGHIRTLYIRRRHRSSVRRPSRSQRRKIRITIRSIRRTMSMRVPHERRNWTRLRMVHRSPKLRDESVRQELPLARVPRQLVQQLDEPLEQHVLVIVVAGLFGGAEEAHRVHVVEAEGLQVLEEAGLGDVDAAGLLATAVFEEGGGF